MPPKRKIDPILPVKRAKLKASARAGTSAGPTKRKQQGEDWKQSRLAPDIPLHMTTRRAAKTSSNHTSPAAPSSAASGSRRSSLNDVAQQSDFDDEPAKRSRMSTDSGSPNGSFGNNTPMNGTQTPELDEPVSEATLQASKTGGKKRRASDDSTQSSRTRPNGVLTRTQSEVSEQQPRRKKRKTTTNTDSANQPPELTDASTAPNSPEQIPDVAISLELQNVLPANGDAPAKIPKRLPGRRRQPHADMNVEVDLRRQLSLKTSYRSVAKVLKGVLDELAQRTINGLDDDSEFHRKCPEYRPLIDGLDKKRDKQLDYLSAWRSERIGQLERVREAEEQIQKHQYINRFEDLRDDFLQRCYFRMKQIEREWKAAQNDATDDEDNVLPPTYTDDPVQEGVDGRLSSKFASRSRAYVEADRELENDVRQKLFDQVRATFVDENEDADDSIEDLTGGFARFAGPDRTEAITHYNISCLADAAHDVERTPSPQIPTPKVEVIPNDQATMLMFLADLSTSQNGQDPSLAVSSKATPAEPYQPTRTTLPAAEPQLTRQPSPAPAPGSPLAIPVQATRSSPTRTSHPVSSHDQDAPRTVLNGMHAVKTPETSEKPAPTRTTHRIMDMLNNDSDVPVSKPRATLPPVQDYQAPNTPSKRDNVIKHETPSRGDATRLENIVNQPDQPEQTEHHIDQQLMDALSGPVPPVTEPPSPARPNLMSWQQASIPTQSSIPPPREADESLRRKDPRDTLRKIRELLDRKAEEHGIARPDRSHWSDYLRQSMPEPAPGYDPQHPSAGMQGTSDTNGHHAHRRGSYDRAQSHWDRDRRQSGSQASRPSPYQGSPPQPYHSEPSRSGPTSTHQSPYASLPPKPPGPPPSNPINFRFAHYDPVPPPQASRTSYQPPASTYPPVSHAPHVPPPPGPYGHTYPSPYQNAYAPPPGPYQAAPPPPPSVPPYPPLKIHQYGGQPILPASMAPPPYSGPTMPHSQPPSATAYSPPQSQASTSQQQPPTIQPSTHSEHSDRRDSNFMGPQSRPRRAYRSYHAPGTQFRTYNGPGGGRGRGGGGG